MQEGDNLRFSKLIVSIVIALNGTFAIAVLYIFFKVGSEPSTLIGAWFAFTTSELWALAGIKKKELHVKEDDNCGDKMGRDA